MENKRQIISTQLRLPENIYKDIKQEAEALGVSINSHIIELLWIGMKARNSFPIYPTSEPQSDHD